MARKIYFGWALLVLSSCDSYSDLGNGYEILDGTRMKLSLTKDKIVLINYTVTGAGRIGDYIIVESKEYTSNSCDYYVIDQRTNEMARLEPSLGGRMRVTIDQAVAAVEALNRRSCKAPRGG